MITVHEHYHSHVNKGFVSEDPESDDSSHPDSYTESDGSSDNDSYGPDCADRLQSRDGHYMKAGTQENYNTSAVISEGTNADSSKAFSSERLKSRLSSRVKNWMLKQKSQNNNLSVAAEDEPHNNINLERPSTKFTVVLHVDPKRHNYGRRATLCEVLFGIVPETFPQPDLLSNGNRGSVDKRVVVKGLVPNGEAIKSGKLKIGDWLHMVDDIAVTTDNIVDILSSITTPKQVTLTVHRTDEAKSLMINKEWSKNNFRSSLVKPVTGDKTSLEELASKYKKVPHVLLYLSTDASESEGVLYRYPPFSNCLAVLKGMFLTLSHVVKDVTLRSPTGSSLVIEDQLIHVGYSSEGNEVLVLALPAFCVSQHSVIQLTSDVTRLLKFQYLSLNKAFGDASNKASLDHFFILYFNHYLSSANVHRRNDSSAVPQIQDIMESVQRIPIPLSVEEQVEKLLSGFESLCDAGCDIPADIEDNFKGTFVMLGSCLFYKGYLVSNHLLNDHLVDVHLYARHYQVLNFTSKDAVAQIVVWKEVYPTHFFKPTKELVNSGFTERDGKWFLLIVALGHSILGMILETGWMPLSLDDNSPVNPLLVRMSRNLLEELDTSGVFAELDRLIEVGTSPALVSADGVAPKSKTSRKLFAKHDNEQMRKLTVQPASSKPDLMQKSLSNSTPSLVGIHGWPGNSFDNQASQGMSSFTKRLAFIDVDRQHLLTSGQGESDADLSLSPSDNTTPLLGGRRSSERGSRTSTFWGSDHESQGGSDGGLFKGNHLKLQRKFASAYDLSNLRRSLEEVEEKCQVGLPQKLVSGSKNTLFHYVHFDKAEGVFLAPVEPAGAIARGPLHSEIVQNFHKCVETIHSLFEHAKIGKDIIRSKEVSKFGFDKSLSCVQEQGVLFQCRRVQTGTKKVTELSYWVVGRLFLNPELREVYVCFEDGATQNSVELAFRLAFGSSI